MVTNLPPQCAGLEKRYREATALRDKIAALEEYMAAIPKHKGTEKLLQQLKTRHAKLRAQQDSERNKKAAGGGFSKFSVKKEGAAQLVVLGPTGVGKSMFLSALTRASPEVSDRPFTTVEPVPGMMTFRGRSDTVGRGARSVPGGASGGAGWGLRVLSLARNCDGLILMGDLANESTAQLEMMLEELRAANLEVIEGTGKVEIQGKENGGIQVVPLRGFTGDAEEIKQLLRARGIHHALVRVGGQVKPEDVLSYLDHPMLMKTAIVVANKLDTPGAEARLHLLRRSCPGLTVVPVSMAKAIGIQELPRQLYTSLGIIRIYTKRTGLDPSTRPMIVKAGSSIGEIAKMIHNDLFHGFKFAKIWGSSRYGGERVGLGFVPRDRDVIEIHA